jgi:hypothetical protein
MGNENSGRWTSPGAKTTVEQCYALDIADWRREGLLRPGTRRSGLWGWREVGTGKVIRDIGYGVEIRVDPHARLAYEVPRTGEYVNYRLDLVCTCPNYGGQRWWFVCPGLVLEACGRRVRKLYLAPGEKYFACRRCCDLCYASQHEDYAHRALSKAQAIRVRLGGSAAMVDEFPPKPKRMRWKTYRLLQARSEELRLKSLQIALRSYARRYYYP